MVGWLVGDLCSGGLGGVRRGLYVSKSWVYFSASEAQIGQGVLGEQGGWKKNKGEMEISRRRLEFIEARFGLLH